MTLSNTLSDSLIEGNVITAGAYTETGTPYYLSALYNTADSTIVNNTFSVNTNVNMVTLAGSGSCIIQNNHFRRGGNSIINYITTFTTPGFAPTASYAPTGDHIITNNIFDYPTVDGTVETLVYGLSGNTIYEKNKNQTKYLTTTVTDNMYPGITTTGYSYGMSYYNTPGGNSTQISGFISPGTVQSGTRIKFVQNISNILPQNVKVLGSAISFVLNTNGTINTGVDGTVTTSLSNTTTDLATSYSNPSSGILNVTLNMTPLSSNVLTYAASSADYSSNAYRFIVSDYSSVSNGVNTDTNCLYFTVNLVFTTLASTTTSANYQLSPVIIKYRW